MAGQHLLDGGVAFGRGRDIADDLESARLQGRQQGVPAGVGFPDQVPAGGHGPAIRGDDRFSPLAPGPGVAPTILKGQGEGAAGQQSFKRRAHVSRGGGQANDEGIGGEKLAADLVRVILRLGAFVARATPQAQLTGRHVQVADVDPFNLVRDRDPVTNSFEKVGCPGFCRKAII